MKKGGLRGGLFVRPPLYSSSIKIELFVGHSGERKEPENAISGGEGRFEGNSRASGG